MIATCKSKKLTALVAALLSLCMLLTLCTVSVFAETEAGTDTETAATTELESTASTEAETDAGTTADTTAGTTAGTTAETTAGTSASTETDAAASGDNTKMIRGLINLGVGALILLVLAILAIKFRAKIPGWVKALKSECGKISWCSKDKLKKNTFVVVVIILIIVIAIAILDFVFSRGVDILVSLF